MTFMRRTPLAWKNLTHDPRRLAIALSGVTFAVVLMFMERGFQNALFDSTVQLVKQFEADIIISCKSRYSLSASSRFPAALLTSARGCTGVKATYPIYLENYLAALRKPHHVSRPIRVVGCDVRAKLLVPELQQVVDAHRRWLLGPHTALIDVQSKESIYGIDPTQPTPAAPLALYLANQDLRLVGTFDLGTDFANDGTLLMSVENFADYFALRAFPADPLTQADVGLVICEDPAEREQVRDRLRRKLGQRVDVRTRDEFMDTEIAFWDDNTPIGAIFKVGVIMGFAVGVLICYQVLFNDISDHLSEFATLMAMGYSSRYFLLLVIRESVYLALLGFIPGVGISWLLFQIISSATGLTMTLSLFEVGLTLSFTVTMCVLSGLFAVRKLLSADPASLF